MYFFLIISHDLSFCGKAGRFSIIKVWHSEKYCQILAFYFVRKVVLYGITF
nr:MAG TPA_asm: hypothetical protein [Caudoviricetes sp.]